MGGSPWRRLSLGCWVDLVGKIPTENGMRLRGSVGREVSIGVRYGAGYAAVGTQEQLALGGPIVLEMEPVVHTRENRSRLDFECVHLR